MLVILLFGLVVALANIAHIKDSPVYHANVERSKRIRRWLELVACSLMKGFIQGVAWPIMLPVKSLFVVCALLTGDKVGKYFVPGRLMGPPALHYGCYLRVYDRN